MGNKKMTKEIFEDFKLYSIKKDAQNLKILTDNQKNHLKDYNFGILKELNTLENFSIKHKEELKLISRFVRNHLFGTMSEQSLYDILHNSNQIVYSSAKFADKQDFSTSSAVAYYAYYICKHGIGYVTRQQYSSLISDMQMISAKKIILSQWQDVSTATESFKIFMKVFDDVFKTAIEKYPNEFIHKLNDRDILCRMVKEKECDIKRFIPIDKYRQINRWNPSDKLFLYLSYGDKSHPFNLELSLEEWVCLLECRTKPNTDCCFCQFKPTKPGRILDLSYNDVYLPDIQEELYVVIDQNVNRIVQEMLHNTNIVAHMHDRKYIKNEIQKQIKDTVSLEDITIKTLAKKYLKWVCSCIYYKVDGTDSEKEKEYRSFHELAKYLQSMGITGIIYPCTRDASLKGKNIVLFEPSDAEPIEGTIKKYHYK